MFGVLTTPQKNDLALNIKISKEIDYNYLLKLNTPHSKLLVLLEPCCHQVVSLHKLVQSIIKLTLHKGKHTCKISTLIGKYIIGKKTRIAKKINTLDWKGKKNNQGFGGANLIPFRLQSF